MIRVECIDAKEDGIPIKEGQIYTVKRQFRGNQNGAEESLPEMEGVSGYTLIEVTGYFRQDRFKVIEDE